MSQTTRYGIETRVDLPFEEAVRKTTEALAAQGFGILTEIDVSATLKKKLGLEFRRYVILGACNPPLAHRALEAEIDLGLLLPCNVIVYESDEGGCVVSAADPKAMMEVTGNPALVPVADEARSLVEKAVRAVENG